MKTLKLFCFLLICSFCFLNTSCLDNKIQEVSDEVIFNKVENEINVPLIGDDAFDNAEEMIKFFSTKKVNGQQKASKEEPKVTLLTKIGEMPQIYEINYGDAYYDAKKNLYRGRIIYTVFSYKESEYRFEEFYINQDRIEGYKKGDVLEKGVLNQSSEQKITNIKNKTTIYRITERKRTTIDNNKTETDYTDDSYSITGYSKGTTYVGEKEVEYNFEIEKPLETVNKWRYFVRGVTNLKIGESTQTTNYGDGDLDNIAIRNLNGIERKIELKW